MPKKCLAIIEVTSHWLLSFFLASPEELRFSWFSTTPVEVGAAWMLFSADWLLVPRVGPPLPKLNWCKLLLLAETPLALKESSSVFSASLVFVPDYQAMTYMGPVTITITITMYVTCYYSI